MKRQTGLVTRDGFTLVEVLIVIAIIGVLMGLTVAAVNTARRVIQGRAIALEVASIEQAVEAYKTKYGSYPPDGSSRAAFEAHFRSAFPNISGSEFTNLYSVANSNAPIISNNPTGVMDPAEALVFCLGGFSKSPTNPFTGPGGPLAPITGGGFQYNVDRNEPFFEFGVEHLTLLTTTITSSSDESTLSVLNAANIVMSNDMLPVYIPKGRALPITYFAASTYRVDSSNYFNHYACNAGVARPYKSDKIKTTIALNAVIAQRDRHFAYMNDKTFQVISAGLDDHFGGTRELYAADGTPHFFRFPSGTPVYIGTASINPVGANYSETPQFPEAAAELVGQITQSDNVANFSEGSLSDSLP